ncbi:histidine kinase [bacterium SCSIO 12741]|nr:histidine kinase [bacterium SCSIO 12741]
MQVLLWGGLWFLFFWIYSDIGNPFYDVGKALMIGVGSMVACSINLNHLIPRYLLPRKYLYYILGLVATITLLSLITDLIIYAWVIFVAGREKSFELVSTIFKWHTTAPFIMTIIASSLWQMAIHNRNMQHEQLSMELRLLKNQINPHFLFNSLNNIYTLILLKSDKAPENLMKLSRMLRYVIYECSEEKVLLSSEIAHIRDYLDLVLLKDSEGLNLHADLESDPGSVRVAPMIFITFIENAFKHGRIEDLENGWVDLKLKVTDGVIIFHLSNSIPRTPSTEEREGGIGLNNVKRRLEVIYPDKHLLEIDNTDREFRVRLEIQTES